MGFPTPEQGDKFKTPVAHTHLIKVESPRGWEIPMSSIISQNLTEIEAVTGCTFARICHVVFRMFSCLQINWQTFYLRQLLILPPFDWLIEIYLQTEGQGTHHKMESLQPMPGFPLC